MADHSIKRLVVMTLLLMGTVSCKRASGPEEAMSRVEKHLEWAQQERDVRLKRSLNLLKPFFARAKEGAHTFSEYALGWGSKGRLIKDCVPFTSHESNKKFLEAKFNEHIFSAKDLENAVREVVTDYIRQINDVDSQMLVRMRLDLAKLPECPWPEVTSQDLFNDRFQHTMQAIQAKLGIQIGTDVASMVATELATQITMKVLQMAIVELGVEGGVLAAGAASSWATLGVGLVIGIIVDKILDWWMDPIGELNKKLSKELDRLHELIVEGDGKEAGLRAKLQEYSKERAKLQRLTVLQMFQMAH
jgi:hypothetical protein